VVISTFPNSLLVARRERMELETKFFINLYPDDPNGGGGGAWLLNDAVVRNGLADHWRGILRPEKGQVNEG